MMTNSEQDAAMRQLITEGFENVNADNDIGCDSAMLIRSMYAGSSTSYIPIDRARSLCKPPPPVKPATLRNKIVSGNTLASSLSLAKSKQAVVDAKVSEFSLISSSSSPVDNDSVSKETSTSTDADASTLETSILLDQRPEARTDQPTDVQSKSVVNSRRASFLNGEIKKPKVKPPPPPTHSRQSPKDYGNSDSTEGEEQVCQESHSIETYNNFTQEVVNFPETISTKFHRFERKCLKEGHIPSVPSIPPPSPPIISPSESINDGMYEEIQQLTYAEENFGKEQVKMSNELTDQVLILENNFDESGTEEFLIAEEKKNGIFDNYFNQNNFGTVLQKTDYGKYYVENKKNDISAREKTTMVRRPKSALEFDKLLRIKSDIQVNITKKVVGQIKLKVSSASQDKRKCQRLSSMFYVNQEKMENRDDDVIAKIDFPLNEQYIYGDDWSSDEDDSTSTINKQNPSDQEQRQEYQTETSKNLPEAASYSMLSEIERELRLRFQPLSNLPDVVLESKRRSLSVDQLPQNSKSIIERPPFDEFKNACEGVEIDSKEILGKSLAETVSDQERMTAKESYEILLPSSLSSPERNYLPSTSSEYTLKEFDRSIYTPRIIPDPQPLYQIYMMEQNDRLMYEDEQDERQPSISGNKVPNVQRAPSIASTDSGRGADCSTTISQLTSNTSMKRNRLIAVSHFGSQRSLWCELPEVRNAGLLEKLDSDTKKLQEAYFEVITSEASYLRSVNILITHFMAAPEMLGNYTFYCEFPGSKGSSSVIVNEERKQLFSNIFAVRDCSERLLSDLENRLQDNLVLSDVCDILCDHFEANFDPYVKYCSNQVYQDRTLRRLKSENSTFLSCIQRLESDRLCQGLDMRSFLMLPMQRVTRYPLLVIAILEHTQHDTTNYQTAQIALHLANKIVTCCNEGARRMERTEQLLEIERRLVYKSSDLKRIPLVSSGRYLVKRGSLTYLTEKRTKKLLNTRQHFQNIYIFLFNDIIMLTKKKVNGTFICKDYSARRFVDIEPVEIDDPKLLQWVTAHIPLKKPHLFICTLMHNAVGKQVELLLNADSETDRERWLSALRPPACTNPEEKIYADWDCPQAVAVHRYSSGQEDELTLEKGDLINVLRKMPDGWLFGERVRDGFSGWFPSSYVQQVLNDHVRAKNYRQRLRVIQAAANLRLRHGKIKAGNEENSRHLIHRFRRLSHTRSMLNG
ncbi:unnamed protein product [Thelazia callipaeda]|uniref:PH domain-containing protein n=1 Tax=Thelazia callipaeda TaxID=103827 RepID=A0A0N5CJT8_THECL|nr:unnamed protein product [Thelazia callipaeda]